MTSLISMMGPERAGMANLPKYFLDYIPDRIIANERVMIQDTFGGLWFDCAGRTR